MDRTPYLLPFTKDRVPAWACPVCRVGRLVLDPKFLMAKETSESRTNRKHEFWEPEWIRYVFSAIFICNDASCKDPIACSGIGSVDTFEYDDDETGWSQSTEDRFVPRFFDPALRLMDIPSQCPDAAAGHLLDSFALFFANPGAALNSARAAVEAVLTDLGVKRFVVAKGKRKPINLHQRIQLLPAKYKELVDMLLAVKWLGNAGSHDGEKPTIADVRMTYDLLEHVLSEIYEKKTGKLKAVAKKINKKKGPLK